MLRSLAAPLLWTAYVATPTRGWGWLDGVPLGPLETAVLAIVWWTWVLRRSLPGTRLLGVLLVAKIALGAAFVDRGFDAHYYANGSWDPPLERSTEFRDRSLTRVDERLSFGGDRSRDLPLYFQNDVRFNFYQPSEPRREGLPYSAVWEGFLLVEDAGSATLYVDADEMASGGLWIDNRQLVALDRATPRTATAMLEEGWHPLRLTVAAPQGAARRVEAGEIIDNTSRPFDSGRVFRQPVGNTRLAIDGPLRRTSRVIDVVLLVWLAILIAGRIRELSVGRLLWFGAIVEAVRYALPYAFRVTVLGGGDDMLMYEHLGRVIALGDPLLQEPGPGGGQGAPFYFQPLYPYFVALAHLVFGEDLFGVIFVQRLLVAATVAWCAAITARLFGTRAAWVTVAVGGLFLYEKLGRWSYVLLAEPLFTPVFVAWTWLLIRLSTEPPSRARVVLAGLVGGIATLIRSTLLLAWPVILPLWAASLGSRRTRTVALLVAVMAATITTATLRNWIVAERFVLVASSFGINLLIGNEPRRPLAPPPPDRSGWYDRLELDAGTRTVLEYAIQDPTDLAVHLGRKAVYSVGLYDLSGLEVFAGTAWSYAGTWLLAIVGIVRMPAAVQPSVVHWLPLALALCHFAAVVLIFPWGYGDRLILPLYPLLIPYAALALEPLARGLDPHARQAGRAVVASSAEARRRVGPPAGRLVRRGAARAREYSTAALRERRNWTYLGYTVAVVHWLQGLELLTALLLPVTALIVARLTRSGLAYRFVGGALWTTALAWIAVQGSLSADAVHDPLFWGLVAAVMLAGSAVTGRWTIVSTLLAWTAGACTMVAILLPAISRASVGESLIELSRRFGPLGTIGVFAVWLQAIAASRVGVPQQGRIIPAVCGALLAALVLCLAGAMPDLTLDASRWIAALGLLLGLAEAHARTRRT